MNCEFIHKNYAKNNNEYSNKLYICTIVSAEVSKQMQNYFQEESIRSWLAKKQCNMCFSSILLSRIEEEKKKICHHKELIWRN